MFSKWVRASALIVLTILAWLLFALLIYGSLSGLRFVVNELVVRQEQSTS